MDIAKMETVTVSEPQYIALESGKLQVVKAAPIPTPETQEYDYDFLIKQRADIIADANKYLEARQAELDNVNELIAQAEALGIKSKIENGRLPKIG